MSIVETSEPASGWVNRLSHPGESTAKLLFLLPLFIAAGITLGVSLDSVMIRLQMPYPVDPWESIYFMDAARAVHGLPVYEKAPLGHATHMYGPLGTYAIAAVFHFIGPTISAGRWISLFAGIAATIIFVLTFVERRTFVYLFIGTSIFVSVHVRCMDLFTNTRPDMLAFLLSTIALLAAYRAQKLNQPGWYGVTALLTVLAFLIKQPYAVTALVPILACVLTRPQPFRKHLIASVVPLVALAIAGLVLRFAFPLIWFYAIKVPRLYPVRGLRLPLGVETLFMYNPFFIAVAMVLLIGAGWESRRDQKMMWIVAASIIGGFMGILAFSKQGGTYNSLLLIYAPMAAFCMMKLPQAIDLIAATKMSRWTRAACSIGLAFTLTATAFGEPLSMRLAFGHASNTPDFAKAVELVKSLDGPVLCPEEPTITYFALGQFDKSLEAEVEAVGTGRRMESWLRNYCRTAKYVISCGTADMPSKTDSLMGNVGFRRVKSDKLGPGYVLWERSTRPAPTTR